MRREFSTRVPLVLFLLCTWIPAAVFALAGAAKVADPFHAARFLSYAIGVAMDDAIALTKAVGTLELLLAIGACAFAGKSRTPAVVGIGLAVFFAGLVLRVMILNPHLTNCGCFGSLFSELAGQHISWHFSLNIVLATLFAGSLLLQQSAMEFARRIAPISADAHRAPAAAS